MTGLTPLEGRLLERRYDELLDPLNKLVMEILDDIYPEKWPYGQSSWGSSWNDYVGTLNEIVRILFPGEGWELDG